MLVSFCLSTCTASFLLATRYSIMTYMMTLEHFTLCVGNVHSAKVHEQFTVNVTNKPHNMTKLRYPVKAVFFSSKPFRFASFCNSLRDETNSDNIWVGAVARVTYPAKKLVKKNLILYVIWFTHSCF